MNIRQAIDILSEHLFYHPNVGFVTDLDLYANRKLHGRLIYQGLQISVENRAGSIRRGIGTDGKPWETRMKIPYGYIRKTDGADGDHVDVFVGPNENARNAHIIHINDPETGKYDEDKVFLGFDSREEARRSFDDHYDKPERFFRGHTVMSMRRFKDHVLDKENHGEKIAAAFLPKIGRSVVGGGPGSGPHEPCPQCGHRDYQIVTWVRKNHKTGGVIKKSAAKCLGCHRRELNMPRTGLDIPHAKRNAK